MNAEQWAVIQNAIIDAVELTTPTLHVHDHVSYSLGYSAAKRDVMTKIALAFATLEEKMR